MRYLFAIIVAVLLLATPAMADSLCNVTGPHNCTEQIDDQLAALTKKTANYVSRTQDAHPFKTQNDYILAASSARDIKCVNGTMLAMLAR